MRSTKETITEEERLQLIGLVTIARRLNQQLDQCVAAAREITGEIDAYGHSSDMMNEDGEIVAMIDKKLDNLGLTVSKAS